MAIEFDAKAHAEVGREIIKSDVHILKEQHGINTRLDAILVGNDPASEYYADMKRKIAMALGIQFKLHRFSDQVPEEKVTNRILRLSELSKVHGVLVEHPTPNIDYLNLISAINRFKDIDGLNPTNLGLMMEHHDIGGLLDHNGRVLMPATALACVSILNEAFKIQAEQEATGSEIDNYLYGKDITLVGIGKTVGGPLKTMLGHLGVTVTGCNIGTKEEKMKRSCREADAIVTAVPEKTKLVTADMVRPGQIVVDAAMIEVDGRNVGNVDFKPVNRIVDYCTPVPGGVGPNTLTQIYRNLIQAIVIQKGLEYPFK